VKCNRKNIIAVSDSKGKNYGTKLSSRFIKTLNFFLKKKKKKVSQPIKKIPQLPIVTIGYRNNFAETAR